MVTNSFITTKPLPNIKCRKKLKKKRKEKDTASCLTSCPTIYYNKI